MYKGDYLSLGTPGFLNTGIDFEQLVAHYLANGCYVEITDQAEIDLAINLMKHVIGSSFGYKNDFASSVNGRFQMIFNSTLQESTAEPTGFIKRSNAVWLLTDSYEKGTDFKSFNGKQIEAKVYKNRDTMTNAAKDGSKDFKVFHGADYVLCYLIDGYELDKDKNTIKHWYWLKKINGIYTVYDNIELEDITRECLPKTIPICYCKLLDNKLIIGRNTFCI